ncbi:MAG: J domain-containing protein [Candidatus Bathyarchaeota archaeon]
MLRVEPIHVNSREPPSDFLWTARLKGYDNQYRIRDVLISGNCRCVIELKYGLSSKDTSLLSKKQLKDIKKHENRFPAPITRLVFFDEEWNMTHEYIYFEQFLRNSCSDNGFFMFCGNLGDIYQFYKGVYLRRIKFSTSYPNNYIVDENGTLFCGSYSRIKMYPLKFRRKTIKFSVDPLSYSGLTNSLTTLDYGRQFIKHLNTLGIVDKKTPEITLTDVKKAFKSLIMKTHPDVIGSEGHEKTVKLVDAYKFLVKLLDKEKLPGEHFSRDVLDDIKASKALTLDLKSKVDLPSQFHIMEIFGDNVYLSGFSFFTPGVLVIDKKGNLKKKFLFKDAYYGNRSLCILEEGTFAICDYNGKIFFVKDNIKRGSIKFSSNENAHWVVVEKLVLSDELFYLAYTSGCDVDHFAIFTDSGKMLFEKQLDDKIMELDFENGILFFTLRKKKCTSYKLSIEKERIKGKT